MSALCNFTPPPKHHKIGLMSIRPPTINGEKNTAVVAITAALIGITLVVSLLVMGLIGEATFATLFTVISLICLFIAFSNRVESISLKELTIKLAKVQEIQQAVIAKETEPPHQLQGIGLKVEGYVADPKTNSVIKAIGSSTYTFRNIDGIIKDTSLHLNEVENSLNWLLANKLAIESSGIGGHVYSLTPKGYDVFSSLLNAQT